MKQNRELLFRRVWVVILQTGFLGFGLLSIGLLGGIAESLGPWWLYALACLGFVCASGLLIGLGEALDSKLAADLKDWQQVPVRKIDRSRRYSA